MTTRIDRSPRPTQRPRPQASEAPAAQTAARPAGWSSTNKTPAAQARALKAFLESPRGATQAAKIIDTVTKKNDLAKALNWEAGHIKAVRPTADGSFTVTVQLDVVRPRTGVDKHYFTAIVNQQGKVLDVPQG